ncbi:MAG: sialate O-acetylesterase [Gammaproteobacteria bacterium]|tara:strand:- start:837 stop:1727 length:891 start_codon:yes stop_codon:yes gene_type:complete
MKAFLYKFSIFSIFITLLITGSFVFGLSTGFYKHFPFGLLHLMKNGTNSPPYFRWGGRNLNIDLYTAKEINPSKKTGIYLTYGQSNASNYGEYGYLIKNDVFQYLLGETFLYEDPSLGGTGTGGSVWGMVGDKLIENGIYEQVIFSNSGWGGKSIEELKNGHEFEFLIVNFKGLIKKFGRVDGILFHQGESDNSLKGVKNYYNSFKDFLNNLEKEGIEAPVYLSRASLCGKKPINRNLTNIQNQLIRDFNLVKEGPDTDLLSSKSDRLEDYCHFSLEGNEKFADMWIQSLSIRDEK